MLNAGGAWLILLATLLLDLGAAAVFLLRQAMRARGQRLRERARETARACSSGSVSEEGDRFLRSHRWTFLQECAAIADAIDLSEAEKKGISTAIERARVDITLIRDLRARSRFRRVRAATYLPLVPSDAARWLLVRAMETEPSSAVKLFLAASLSALGEDYAIPTLIDSLAGEPLRYQRSLWGLLSEYGENFAALLPVLAARAEKEIQLLLIDFAGGYRTAAFRDYLISRLDSGDLDITQAAFRALCTAYPASLDYRRFLASDDSFIRNLAAESLGNFPTAQSMGTLFEHLEDGLIRRNVILSLTAIIRARPQHFRTLMLRCLNEESPAARATLVTVLAGFVDYLMEKLLTSDAPLFERVLTEILRQGRTSDIVNFLNRNTNPAIEARALALLREGIASTPTVAPALQQFLDPRLLAALALQTGESRGKAAGAQGAPEPPAPSPVPCGRGWADSRHLPCLRGAGRACLSFGPRGCSTVSFRFQCRFRGVRRGAQLPLPVPSCLFLCRGHSPGAGHRADATVVPVQGARPPLHLHHFSRLQ